MQDPEAPHNQPDTPTLSVDETSVTRVSMLVNGSFGHDLTDITSYGVELSTTLFESGGEVQTLTPQEVGPDGYALGISGLSPNETYYLRAFISNGHSKMYSSVITQKTPETSVASVSDVTLSADGTYMTATLEDNGGRSVEEVGFVWGSTNDRRSLRREKRYPATIGQDGRFSLPLSLLGPGTHYLLAYAEDNKEATGFSRIPYEHKVKDKTWNKVFQMSNYETNSIFVWDKGITLNPSSVTLQWKFLSNEWNKVSNDSQCNRLGSFCNANEQIIVLIRFSDYLGIDGQLEINTNALGRNQVYITKNGIDYSWPVNKWVVLTIVSDGSMLHIYQDDTLIQSCEYDQPLNESWELERLDLSMTWDDGSTDFLKKQAFNGYTAFIRVWSRPLSISEIASTLCDVPYDKMEGLEACWNFNGSFDSLIENSAPKNTNYAIDFSKCIDQSNEIVDKSSIAASAWITPSNANIPEVCE